jgi:large subunit ribosomal protein L19e
MGVNVQKRLAGYILKTSRHNVRFDPQRLDDIKEAITKADIKSLIAEGAISVAHIQGTSKGSARKIKRQKRKGRQKGVGSRKGKAGARLPGKREWINRVRIQRGFLKELKDKKMLDSTTYNGLYLKVKGGFFRSKRHIKLYITEHKLVTEKKA